MTATSNAVLAAKFEESLPASVSQPSHRFVARSNRAGAPPLQGANYRLSPAEIVHG